MIGNASMSFCVDTEEERMEGDIVYGRGGGKRQREGKDKAVGR